MELLFCTTAACHGNIGSIVGCSEYGWIRGVEPLDETGPPVARRSSSRRANHGTELGVFHIIMSLSGLFHLRRGFCG